MKLYNPTPEDITGGFDGKYYPIAPGMSIDVPELIGNWVLERESFKGLRKLDLAPLLSSKTKDSKKEFEKYLVEESWKGLELYISAKNEVLNQWINFDTEMKKENQFGTQLQNRDVKKVVRAIETAKGMIKDLEAKYNVSFEKDDIIQKSNELQSSITTLISEFEADSEKKNLAERQEKELNSLLNDLMPKAGKMTGNHSATV